MSSKTLLIGPAGSGKTHQVLEEFVEALRSSPDPLAEDTFLILPTAEHVDRAVTLVLARGCPGFFHDRITTLSRFTGKIFHVPEERVASPVLRALILRELLASQSWPCFEKVQDQPGLLDLLLHAFSEWKESRFSVEDFRNRMNRLKTLEPDLSPKYESLAGLFELYETRLRAEGCVDRQDLFQIFKEKHAERTRERFRFKKIWLDGFFDFSNLQRAYLMEIAGLTDEITVTLTKDSGRSREALFQAALETEQVLVSQGFQIKNLASKSYRTEVPSLQVLEQFIFSEKKLTQTQASSGSSSCFLKDLPGSDTLADSELAGKDLLKTTPSVASREVFSASPSTDSSGSRAESRDSAGPKGRGLFEQEKFSEKQPSKKSVKIFEAVGVQGEMEMIAREIRTQVRERGLRFSEISVLFRQIGAYEPVIRSVFRRYGIPVEIHERARLRLSPLLQVVASLLRIFRDGWKREDLFHFLKSSYVRRLGNQPKKLDMICEIEQMARRSRSYQGRDSWLSLTAGLDDKNSKSGFLETLVQLEDDLNAAKSLVEIRRHLWKALTETFGIFEFSSENPELEARDKACLRRMEALYEEIRIHETACARSEYSRAQFTDHFLALADLDLYSIPEDDPNRVQVYSVSLARQKEYRTVFVAGLLEKQFPLQIREDPVLSDWERELLNQFGEEKLALRLPRQSIERYFFYLAVTRAQESLILTYPKVDREGKESLPSFYVAEVRGLLGAALEEKTEELSRPYPDLGEVASKQELHAALLGGLWHAGEAEEPSLLTVLHHTLQDAEQKWIFERALDIPDAKLHDPEILKDAGFQLEKTSATKLEEYAACPFRYFSNWVLHLKDPDEDRTVMDKGTALHQVLEDFFRARIKNQRALDSIKAIRDFVDEHLDQALRDKPLALEKTYQRDAARREMFDMLIRFLENEVERLRDSVLQPAHLEFNFGAGKNPDHPAVLFPLEGQRPVLLTGKIDRIDADPKKKFGLVLDYKRSAKFDRKKMELGVALQLPLYLKIVESVLGLQPIGGELYSIRERKAGGFYHKQNIEGVKQISSRALALSEKEFRELLERSYRFVQYFASRIRLGSVEVRPRDCADYCAYSAVCRIEKWNLDSIKEEIKAEDQKRWPSLSKGDEA